MARTKQLVLSLRMDKFFAWGTQINVKFRHRPSGELTLYRQSFSKEQIRSKTEKTAKNILMEHPKLILKILRSSAPGEH